MFWGIGLFLWNSWFIQFLHVFLKSILTSKLGQDFSIQLKHLKCQPCTASLYGLINDLIRGTILEHLFWHLISGPKRGMCIKKAIFSICNKETYNNSWNRIQKRLVVSLTSNAKWKYTCKYIAIIFQNWMQPNNPRGGPCLNIKFMRNLAFLQSIVIYLLIKL